MLLIRKLFVSVCITLLLCSTDTCFCYGNRTLGYDHVSGRGPVQSSINCDSAVKITSSENKSIASLSSLLSSKLPVSNNTKISLHVIQLKINSITSLLPL